VVNSEDGYCRTEVIAHNNESTGRAGMGGVVRGGREKGGACVVGVCFTSKLQVRA